MRILSKTATRWQLLRLISVWGATILCLYCITVGTNFWKSRVDNRLINEVYKRNLTSSEHYTVDHGVSDSMRFPNTPVLFKTEGTPTTATPDSDPFDPVQAAMAYSDGDGDAVPSPFKPDQTAGMGTLWDRPLDETHLLFSNDLEENEDEGSEKGSLKENDDQGDNEGDGDERTPKDDDDDDDDDDSRVDEDREKEDRDEKTDTSRGREEEKESDVKMPPKLDNGGEGKRGDSPNDAIVRRWLRDHLKINGSVDWREHAFPVWKLDLDPEAVGQYKTPNWPWVTLEVGRYSPNLFTHPPGELPTQRLPKVIIFGAGKCGTRALIEFLKMHPNIASARAEVHYFDENLDKGVEWYRKMMPLSYSNQVTLEKSPSYLWEPTAPEQLYKINKDVKLILLVKDPVVRIMSQAARMDDAEHRHELLFVGERDGKKYVKQNSNTVMAGLYVEHLRNWLKVFPLEQMHVMEGMQLIRNPYKEIKKVETFLELPNVLTEANFFLNETRGFYCPYPFYSRLPECLSSAKGVPHPKLSRDTEKLIYDFYRPYNEKLFQIIGKRFDWEPKVE